MKIENPFEDIDKLALDKYIIMLPKYGTSWETMQLAKLQERLREECAELLEGHNLEEIHKEALDVLNIARMIAKRTKDFI